MNKLNQNKISIFVKTNHQDFLKKKNPSNKESNNPHLRWTYAEKLHLNEINILSSKKKKKKEIKWMS